MFSFIDWKENRRGGVQSISMKHLVEDRFLWCFIFLLNSGEYFLLRAY